MLTARRLGRRPEHAVSAPRCRRDFPCGAPAEACESVADQFEIVDVEPDLKPLFLALAKCGISSHRILGQTIARLVGGLESLFIPTADNGEYANAILESLIPFDGDMAACMLRRREGRPDPKVTWKRKRARRLWEWVLDPTLDTTPQGRPPEIDSALVLYCARVLCEACRRQKFRFSRPPGGGPPYGPMWRALTAALPLAESRIDTALACAPRSVSEHAETIADILTTANSRQFTELCRQLNLGPSSNDVAQHPATFRYVVAVARRPRERKRRT
jgi:hypothetical protein